MIAFSTLIQQLDQTNKTNEKVLALRNYFLSTPPEDVLWTIALLSHRRPPRPVTTTLMRTWAAELAGLPLWLFEESYHIVGDLAETIALVIPESTATLKPQKLNMLMEAIIALKPKGEDEKKKFIIDHWQSLTGLQRFAFNKLITGGLRIGISQKLMTRALAQAFEMEENHIAHRLMGQWTPQNTTLDQLLFNPNPEDLLSQPYPFYLAHPLQDRPDQLGECAAWIVEHKWDGMRGQLILRQGKWYCWSRGEELISEKFPEFEAFLSLPNGTVLDGEILPYKAGKIQHFALLQKRIGRKNISPKLLEQYPVVLMVYDLLEWEGNDIRAKSAVERRELMERLFDQYQNQNLPWLLSPSLHLPSWRAVEEERQKATAIQSEGLMLKRADSPYGVGRKKGDWWKWKSDPLTIDAVLTYAMRGHGRRTNLYTDYTFALWQGDTLVTFAKAYSGLTDEEFRKVDAYVKKNTLERFGPVRRVKPALVFEIAFEGIAPSTRHKSGVAVRFPRILRWRHDKKITAANTLDELKALIVQ
ncbi:MAG: ATP-dependent DNA ligase [Flavobacteriaceae bacterium]|jgi:DNA ligase-1